ncbi:MAG: ubiquitin [Alkaliphilus sp.]|nr:DUF4342 domain-containing protein [bacterium AH-315-G05]PHS36423.1 MAG: ubiquitin [Alkaliphilus sp.]
MDINLESIDIIRERAGVSYKKAKEAIEQTNGNIVDALIFLEEVVDEKKWSESVGEIGNDIIGKIKELAKKGNVTRIIIKKEGDVLLNIPVTAGAIGIVLAPIASIVGVSAAILAKMTVEIVTKDGEIVNINKFTSAKNENNGINNEEVD